MKKMKAITLGTAIAGALAGSMMSTSAVAGVTGNIGFMSDYYFRGVQQSSGVASAGLDYEHDSGIYAGIWAADIGGHGSVGTPSNGIETDYYFGYGGEIEGIAYGIGYTTYQYTGDGFDTAYNEVNLSAGYGPVSIEFSMGSRVDGVAVGVDADYTFTAISGEYESLTATYGFWGEDFDGAYLEVGFAKEFSELDFGVSIINGMAEENSTAKVGNFASNGTALVFTIGKTFDL